MRPTPVTYALAALMVGTMVLVYVASYLNPASSRLTWLGLLAFLVVVLIGTAIALRTWGPPGPLRLVDVIASTSAAAMTLLLIRSLGIPTLVAAAIVATGLGVAMLDGGPLDTVAGTAGYAGVFVGLVDPSVTIPLYWVLIAGALVGVLWGLISPALFRGAGGRMSTAAFLASILVYQVADVLGERGGAEMLPPLTASPTGPWCPPVRCRRSSPGSWCTGGGGACPWHQVSRRCWCAGAWPCGVPRPSRWWWEPPGSAAPPWGAPMPRNCQAPRGWAWPA